MGRTGRFPTHGHCVNEKRSPTWYSWNAMIGRCTRPSMNGYHRYGGRGIRVCKRWLKFNNFLADMGVRPEGHTLDRKNGNGHYTLSNCQWSTAREQSRHTCRTAWVKPKGHPRMSMKAAAELFNMSPYTLATRLRRKWSLMRALTEPAQRGRRRKDRT